VSGFGAIEHNHEVHEGFAMVTKQLSDPIGTSPRVVTFVMALVAFVVAVWVVVPGVRAQASSPIRLTDITKTAGIDFTHNNGAFGRKYLPETLGSGAAFLDYDNDGRQDLFLVNGTNWPGQPPAGSRSKLLRNIGNGTFKDVTSRTGLAVDVYGMGAAAADFDNDGWQDLLVTAVGQNTLYRNTGKGTFVDVTARAGLGNRAGFSTSALWFDYDRDGWLDLLVCNYVRWTPETDVRCSVDGKQKAYCTPEAYRGTTSWLFRNKGNGTFEDVTAKAGLFDATSKSLGVTLVDYDADPWPDVFIANDTQPNKLYRNNGNGTFVELGLKAGLALSEEGRARAGMGVDAADVDNTGSPTVVITNFSGEMLGLYKPVGDGQFQDSAPRSEVGRATRQTLGFGCFFFDVDLDGLQDLLVVNGHIDDTFTRANSRVAYAEPPHLFHNRGRGRFADIAPAIGGAFAAPKVGRGAAFADVDGDLDLDVVLTTNGGPAALYRNDSATGNHALRLRLRGLTSNRDGIGARVRVFAGRDRLSRTVKTGSSYLSQSELPLTFGLGKASKAERVVVEWPSGKVDELQNVAAGKSYTLIEGKGIAP
jgi:enediyne biosynthesis protein E4